MKKVILLLITALLIFTLCACGKDNSSSNVKTGEKTVSQSGTVAVPNVVGMDKNEAVKKLEELGLNVKINYKHCVTKENDDFTFLPDKSVLEQSVQPDGIIKKSAVVTLTVQTLTDKFETRENEDGTVTLVERKSNVNFSNGKCVIPKIYEDKKVSKIYAAVVNEIYLWNEIPSDKLLPVKTVEIPKGIEIIGKIETKLEIVYY